MTREGAPDRDDGGQVAAGDLVGRFRRRFDAPTRRRLDIHRRELRREMSRLRDRRRLLAMGLLILTFGLLAAGIVGRGEPAGADARAYWAGVRIWLNGGDPVPPDRAVPAVRLCPVDAAALRPVGAAAVGRRVVRLAWRDDPPAAVDDPLGVPPAAAGDRDPRRAARVPVRGEPRHRQHQLAADADAVGCPVHGSRCGRPAVVGCDLDEVGAGPAPADSRPTSAALGPRFPRRVGVAQPRDAAADDPPAPGDLRLWFAAAPARLPRLPLGGRAGPLATPGTVLLAPTVVLARGDRESATTAGGPRLGQRVRDYLGLGAGG